MFFFFFSHSLLFLYHSLKKFCVILFDICIKLVFPILFIFVFNFCHLPHIQWCKLKFYKCNGPLFTLAPPALACKPPPPPPNSKYALPSLGYVHNNLGDKLLLLNFGTKFQGLYYRLTNF